jgi:hypothetical protein
MMTRKDKNGVLIIFGVSVVFLLLFALTYRLKASADNFDSMTLCPNNGDYPVVKLLIDKTDPWEKRDRQRLANIIRRIKDRLAEHERLSIFVLDETGTYSPSPVFDMCSPGRGDQANSLYENPRLIQSKFEEKFAAPLDNIGLRGSERNVRLVVVSDMMQNTEALSLYRKQAVAISNDKVNDLCESSYSYNSVEVYFINRPRLSVAARQEARNFWGQCFNRMTDSLSWEGL